MRSEITYSEDVWSGDGELGKDSVDSEAKEESDRKECGVHLEYTGGWAGGVIRMGERWGTRGTGRGVRQEGKYKTASNPPHHQTPPNTCGNKENNHLHQHSGPPHPRFYLFKDSFYWRRA
jgi:hypothetical protein